jgi:hypothetical protein
MCLNLISCWKKVFLLNAVKAYYDGRVFVPVEPVSAKRNQNALITILDETKEKPHVRFIGVLSDESYEEISEALKDTQEVDSDEW